MLISLDDVRPRMEKALEVVRGEISSIRTGRATTAIVENVVCSVYGGTQKLKLTELAVLSTPDPTTITVIPYDLSIIGEIRNSISTSNIGLNPIIDNNLIRISVPPLSLERRQEYVKLLRHHLENGKIMIRQIRHDKMIDIKKAQEAKEISEDERFRAEEELQKITDECVGKIEQIGEKKEEELLGVG